MIHVCDKPTFSFCMTQQIFNKMKHRRNFKCHFILCYIRSEAAKPSHLQSRLRLLIFPKDCLFLPDLYHSVKTNVFYKKLKCWIQLAKQNKSHMPQLKHRSNILSKSKKIKRTVLTNAHTSHRKLKQKIYTYQNVYFSPFQS